MTLIALDELLPLDCVRGTGCCHGHLIPVTPWENAILARSLAMAPADFLARHTIAAGTRLRPDGPIDSSGRKGCGLLAGATGCSVHAARPLACRLYPLGRQLVDGEARYHHPGDRPGCHVHCPSIARQAPRRVSDWLAGQDVGLGELAHDAYGRLACGLLSQSADLARTSGGELLRHELRYRATLSAEARAALLPADWNLLLAAPALAAQLDDPRAFVLAHAERLLGAAVAGFGEDDAALALLLATCGLQLGDPVGIAAANAADFVERRLAA